jgi:hypothetical protein
MAHQHASRGHGLAFHIQDHRGERQRPLHRFLVSHFIGCRAGPGKQRNNNFGNDLVRFQIVFALIFRLGYPIKLLQRTSRLPLGPTR